METWSGVDLSELVERRYLGLVELVRLISGARDWKQLASAISVGLERAYADPAEEPPAVRIWVITAEGFEESARYPASHDFGRCPPRELRRASRSLEPSDTAGGGVLVGLQEGGVSLGAVEVDDPSADAALLVHAAPVISSRVGILASQGVGDILLAPVPVDGAGDLGALMSTFACEAKRQLSHDRLSAYLLTNQGRAFERFAVATSPIIPGEGVIIPFEEVGLRHVVITDRALVSPDLATDPRVVGREDRVIAAAGFHGLLSVPLRVQGRPIGVLNFVSRTPGFYREEDIPIAQQIADQVAAFLENLHVQQRMRALISHEAAERERTRIGRDIYHVVAQNVPSIARIVTELEAATPATDATRRQLARVRELASGTLADVRRAIADLLPRDLDAATLEEAVRATLAPLGEGDPKPRLKVVGDTAAISPAVRRAAWRIVQEAITNVRLHASAGNVTVSIECDRDLRLTVADDGKGFDPQAVKPAGGMGLDHMRERARALGGVVEIESAPGRGTEVRFEVLGVSDAADQPTSAPELDAGTQANTHVRVFVIDRHPLMRAGLLHLAEEAEDLRVVGDAANVPDGRAQVRRVRPDVLLLDGHLPVAETEQLVRDLREELPLLRIVITFESTTGHEAVLAEAGASRFLRKTAGAAEFTEVIRSAAARNDPASGGLSLPLDHGPLSPRERSILLLMAAGWTNSEIGKSLFLATKTVERQVATIVGKLGARNRAHAAALAVARSIVDPNQADSRH